VDFKSANANSTVVGAPPLASNTPRGRLPAKASTLFLHETPHLSLSLVGGVGFKGEEGTPATLVLPSGEVGISSSRRVHQDDLGGDGLVGPSWSYHAFSHDYLLVLRRYARTPYLLQAPREHGQAGEDDGVLLFRLHHGGKALVEEATSTMDGAGLDEVSIR